MEKIEITGRVFKIEEKKNSNAITLVLNKSVRGVNNTFDSITIYYACLFSKDTKINYRVGDMILVRGNFAVDTYQKNDGTYTSAIKIFVSDHECIMRKKIDTPVITQNTTASEFNEIEEPF